MIDGKGKFRLINNIAAPIVLLTALLLAPMASFAQDLPCSGNDPYESNCPLDTNVWLLAAIALVAGAVFLYKQQKIQHKKI